MNCDVSEEYSVPALWEVARYLLHWLISICGDPCAIVAEVRLSPKERREIVFWLRPVEALVRRLLVVEAARMAQTLPPVRKGPRKTVKRPPNRSRQRRAIFPNTDDSAGWRVRFALRERPAAARPAAARNICPARVHDMSMEVAVLAPARLEFSAAQHRLARLSEGAHAAERSCGHSGEVVPKASRAAGNPWPLARRIEAVRRVLGNPQPYARRLARRLKKDTTRIADACRPPPPREPGRRPSYGDEPLRHASEHALRALSPYDTS